MTNRCCSFVVSLALALTVLSSCGHTSAESVGLYPEHTSLRVGERIHYSILQLEDGKPIFEQEDGAPTFIENYRLIPKNPAVVRSIGGGIVEALSPGRAEVIVQSEVGERVFSIDVGAVARPAILATHHSQVDRITGEELLFVGHANLDGFDHTAVAKPGIDRLVRDFKALGHPVVYFVSDEYPYWYTEDRKPDLAIVSEGQEHEIEVDAERVVFSGGAFLVCLARNVQMTLHGMLKAANRDRIDFAIQADAVWVVDNRYSQSYPAPAVLLEDVISDRSSVQDIYKEVMIPFLDRTLRDFPIIGYPTTAPEPALEELVDGWTVEVALDEALVHSYQSGDPNKVIRIEFCSKSAT